MKKVYTPKRKPQWLGAAPWLRGLSLLLVLLASLAALVPQPAYAQLAGLLGIGTIAGSVIAWIAYGISYLISYIVGGLIALVSFFVEVALYLNTQVVNALAVQEGFKVSLAVANLGFVLAIVIIAIATILRRETYGIKQLLWKLIVAAVLVNFSLVIAGTIVNFTDQLALYFLNGVNPAGSNSSFGGFASALAGAFTPQRGILTLSLDGDNPTATIEKVQGAAAGSGASFAAILTPLISLAFVIIFLIAILFVLITFLVLLMIRYVYLAVLLILMPFAWLFWIFPTTSHLWSKWWSKFFQWSIFAPIVVFFLYLAILTAQGMSDAANDPLAAYRGIAVKEANSPVSGLEAFVAGFASKLAGDFMQMLLVIGLSIGGIIAANSMSIMGASTAMGMVNKATGAAKGWAGRRGKQLASYPARAKIGGKSVTERAEGFAARMQQNKFLRYTGIAKLGGFAASGVANVAATGSGLVEDHKKRSSGKTVEQLKARRLIATNPEKLAIDQIMAEKKLLDQSNLPSVINTKMETVAKDYGAGNYQEYKERVQKTAMHSSVMGDRFNEIEQAKTPEERAALEEKYKDEITDEASTTAARYKKGEFNWAQLGDFLQATKKADDLDEKLERGEINKEAHAKGMAQVGDFGLTPEAARRRTKYILRGVVEGGEDMLVPLLSGLKQRGLSQFEKMWGDMEDQMITETDKMPAGKERDDRFAKLDRLKKKIDQSLAINAIFAAEYIPAGAEAVSAKPAQPATKAPEPKPGPPPPGPPPGVRA